MIVNAIYHGSKQVFREYHGSQLIFQRNPIQFHVIEDDKLIIMGALAAANLPDGLYLDCSPEWTFPDLNNNVLTIRQAYSATLNGNVLEVK